MDVTNAQFCEMLLRHSEMKFQSIAQRFQADDWELFTLL